MTKPDNRPVLMTGHVLEKLGELEDEFIDMVATSPPYWSLRFYGDETKTVWGGDSNCDHEWNEFKRKGITGGTKSEMVKIKGEENFQIVPDSKQNICQNCGAWFGQLGLEPHPQMYINNIVTICREIKRVLKKSGSFYLNLGDTYFGSAAGSSRDETAVGGGVKKLLEQKKQGRIPQPKLRTNWLQPKQLMLMPSRVAIALQDDGWILRNDNIWHKPNSMPSSVKDRLKNSYEHVFHFVKSKKYYYDLDSIREPSKDPEDDIRRITKGKGYNHKTTQLNWTARLEDDYVDKQQLANKDKGYREQGKSVWGGNQRSRGISQIYSEAMNKGDKGKNPGDFWEINTQPFPEAHFATWPEELVERMIKASCPKDGIVLDTFSGSGTTGKVAMELDRRSILIDIKPDYMKVAKKRLFDKSSYLEKFEGVKHGK